MARLLYEIANRPANLDAIVLFTLIYWRLDRGGPDGRTGVWQGQAHFHFPRGDAAEGVSGDWQPSFVDYLYLAFTTSTAFSPSEIYPLTDRAKILHIVQSLISLLTIVALATRAINILGQ